MLMLELMLDKVSLALKLIVSTKLIATQIKSCSSYDGFCQLRLIVKLYETRPSEGYKC